MHDLEALRLQIEWGVDEALLEAPVDRFMVLAEPPPPPSSQAPHHAPSQAAARIAVPLVPGADLPALAARTAAAATTLPGLLAAIDAFTACPLRTTASTSVTPSGDPGAGLLLIGGPPGPDDDRAGHAFSGPGGVILDRILATIGLTRDRLLLAPLIPWRPPGGRPVRDAELAACLPFLHRLIALVQPRRIVLMGASPTRALSPDPAPLRRLRGKWTALAIPGLPAPIPALPTLDPESWLASPANRETTWTDLLALKSNLDVLP